MAGGCLTLVSKQRSGACALEVADDHTHFTRLQRSRGVMDPTVKSAFEEVLRRFNAFDAKWESKFADTESARREREAETDCRVSELEGFAASVPRA